MNYDWFVAKKVTRLGEWSAQRARKNTLRHILKLRPSSILEIGPGRGQLADMIVQQGIPYCGIERNPTLHRQMLDKGHSMERRSWDHIEDKSWDVVVAAHVLEHSGDPGTMLCNMERMAKTGAVVVVPDLISWQWDFYDCDYTHHYPFTATRLRQIFHDVGFRDVHTARRYGSLPAFPGWLADKILSLIPAPLKVRCTLHANIVAVGRKAL